MADQTRLAKLFNQYLQRKCTPEEVEELVALLQADGTDEMLTPAMRKLWEQMRKDQKEYSAMDWEQMYERITGADRPSSARRIRRRRLYTIAAALAGIVISSVGAYIWYREYTEQKSVAVEAKTVNHDVPPGGNKAILTLANGATIILDQAADGTLAEQGNTRIIKQGSGRLAYQPPENSASGPAQVEYNTLTTPRGGQYQLELSDGTRVWLNAASSIHFPTVFRGKERHVEITGEAYFEVAGNPSRPFIVDKGHTEIQVLGTHFNVNAYEDEANMEVTLLEGSVKVIQLTTHSSRLIKPGQQVLLNKNGEIKLIEKADVDETVAWKNGLFVFHNDDLPVIMRRLARWYDVETEYQANQIPQSHFTGAIRRQENISKVLEMLSLTGGAHFDIEGRKVIVTP